MAAHALTGEPARLPPRQSGRRLDCQDCRSPPRGVAVRCRAGYARGHSRTRGTLRPCWTRIFQELARSAALVRRRTAPHRCRSVTTVVVIAAPRSPVVGLGCLPSPMNQHMSLLPVASLAEMLQLDIDGEGRYSRIAVRQDGHGDALERSSQGADHRHRCRWRRPDSGPTSTLCACKPGAGASARSGTLVVGANAVRVIMFVGAMLEGRRGSDRG